MASIRDLVRAQVDTKALAPNAAFEDPGRPVGVVDLNMGRIAGQNPNSGMSGGPRVKQKQAARHLTAYGGEQAMHWVYDCVRYTAEKVANAEYHFEKQKTEPEAERSPGTPVAPPKPLYELLEQPNAYMDYIEMMEVLVMDLLLVGNAYLMKWRSGENGKPLALYRLAPPYVEVDAKPWGVGGYWYQIPNADKLHIEAPEVVHFKLGNPDPANPYYGMGVIAGAGRAADEAISITDTKASYWENHTMPSAVLESQRRVPRDVFKKIRAQMHARASGSKNAGELLVLEAGLKLSPFASNARDAEFQALTRMSRSDIFALFRMSPKLVGINDESTEPIADAKRTFDTETARPLMNKLQKKMSFGLINAWDLDYVIDYEYQLDPSEQANLGATYAKVPGVMVEEVRKFMGLAPLDDDEINKLVLNVPGGEGGTGAPGDPTEKGFPDRNLPGEAGRPPRGENTKAFNQQGAQVKRQRPNSRPQKTEGKSFLDGILDQLTELETKAMKDPGEHPPEDTLHHQRTQDINAAATPLESQLGDAAEALQGELLAELGEGTKALGAKDVRNAEAWNPFVEKVRDALETGLNRVLSASAVHHASVGIQPEDELDYSKVVNKILRDKETGINGILGTLKSMIATAVKGADEGEESKAVEDAIATWTNDNASTIALTTLVAGYNEGTLLAGNAAGANEYLVSDGMDHDEPCIEANGETWSAEKCAENLYEHPNCRRAFVPLISS